MKLEPGILCWIVDGDNRPLLDLGRGQRRVLRVEGHGSEHHWETHCTENGEARYPATTSLRPIPGQNTPLPKATA